MNVVTTKKSKAGAEPLTVVEAPTAEGGATYSENLVTLSDPTGVSAEAVRALRTHVLAQHVRSGRRALAICSPNVGSGCTFVAANLAIALAQIGLKVLLIDADLREPTIDKFITPPQPTDGLTGCLSEAGGYFPDYIQPEVFPNLSVLYGGRATSNAQELLAHHRFEDGVNACLRNYDLTVIDTPPANTCADARRICDVAGFALIVARRHRSLVPDVKALCRELTSDDTTVIGTVLND